MLGKSNGGIYKAPTKEERRKRRLRGEIDQIMLSDHRFERWQVVRFRKARKMTSNNDNDNDDNNDNNNDNEIDNDNNKTWHALLLRGSATPTISSHSSHRSDNLDWTSYKLSWR